MTGPAVQRRTWNLSALFQLPTGTGPVWLKATPRFAADEAGVIAAFARADPSLVPPVIGAAPGRVLLEHLPGAHLGHPLPPSAPPSAARRATGRSLSDQARSVSAR